MLGGAHSHKSLLICPKYQFINIYFILKAQRSTSGSEETVTCLLLTVTSLGDQRDAELWFSETSTWLLFLKKTTKKHIIHIITLDKIKIIVLYILLTKPRKIRRIKPEFFIPIVKHKDIIHHTFNFNFFLIYIRPSNGTAVGWWVDGSYSAVSNILTQWNKVLCCLCLGTLQNKLTKKSPKSG